MAITINRKWFATSILELSIVMIVMGFILSTLYVLTTDAYKKYNGYRIKNFVIEENTKFLKAVAWARFGETLKYIDESPINHPNLSNMIISFPNEKKIEFRPDDLWVDDTNDITFFNIDDQEIYTYNKDIIEIKKFKVTQLDDTVHRWWVRIHIVLWASWKRNELTGKQNQLTARIFWNNEYFLDYYITYTFRNTPQED